jgi:hypothetical protein
LFAQRTPSPKGTPWSFGLLEEAALCSPSGERGPLAINFIFTIDLTEFYSNLNNSPPDTAGQAENTEQH